MQQDTVDRLRADLSRLDGPARLPTLVTLGQALMKRYVTIGPGTPAARPALDAAVDALAEAYGYPSADDPVRSQVAGLRGLATAARYGAHGGVDSDRDTGIKLLEEGLSRPGPNPAVRVVWQLTLGQLYLFRAIEHLQHGGSALRAGGVPTQVAADAERGHACLQAVIDGETVSEELTAAARTMAELAEVVQAICGAAGGGLTAFNLAGIADLVNRLQVLQQRMQSGTAVGYRMPATDLLPLGLDLQLRDPLDRPVAVVHGSDGTVENGPPRGRPDPPSAASDVPAPPSQASADAGIRQSRDALLSAGDGDGNGNGDGDGATVWHAAAELIRPGAPARDIATIDELVALASATVDLSRPDRDTVADPAGGRDPAVTAVDSYVLAVALLLRDRADDDSAGADRRAGAQELLSAATWIPLNHPAAIVILRSLGAFLSEQRPLDLPAHVAGGYADRLDRAIATGVADPADLVTLHALRCLCRACESLTELGRTAGTVPPEYPWLAQVKAAGDLARAASG
jgi:hypothetical protein